MNATEAAVAQAASNFANPVEINEAVTYTAPCPSGHADARWTSQRIAANQTRTLLSCASCA